MTRPSTQQLVRMVAERLEATGGKVATCASPTAGDIREALSNHPATSQWFVGGVIFDGSELQDVGNDLIDWDAVAPEAVALIQAHVTRDVLGSSYAVVVTGNAGPITADSQHWVNTVCIVVAGPDRNIVNSQRIVGDRDLVLRVTIDLALVMLVALIDDHEPLDED